MSPILVRPVREQLEHDRIIRLLHAKFRRRHEAVMNPGNEQNAGVGTGTSALYPDLLLMSQERGHKLQVVVEIETGESVNHLEALAQWAHFARTRAAFHLYVPAGMVDVARRLSEDNQIYVSEIWSYHIVGDQPRFTLVHRNREAPPPLPKPAPKPAAAKPAAPKPEAEKPPRAVKKPAARSASRPKSRPKAKTKSVVKKQKR
ncbi:MAG TPA: hypothetical protein VKE51_38315 [Vicinamibacterales bacterium]|nr:hypothetical protein [Vicinamibacterales bacterium]